MKFHKILLANFHESIWHIFKIVNSLRNGGGSICNRPVIDLPANDPVSLGDRKSAGIVMTKFVYHISSVLDMQPKYTLASSITLDISWL